tara:strand:- start:364 stop:570 length:207 start_codon:yes stop_codon:yes gene_type:complete
MGKTRRYEKSWGPKLRDKKKRREIKSLNKHHTSPQGGGDIEEDYGEEETFERFRTFERFHSDKDSDRV